MQISTNGINLIKSFEGCKLTAYKPVATEKCFTIGYGHYGADVKEGMKITQAKADALLLSDLTKSIEYVNAIIKAKYTNMNQNQFDALVSFVFNCGKGNLTKLTNSNKRTLAEISEHILAYNKASGKVLAGLTKRRTAEKKLFDTPVKVVLPVVPKPTLRRGSHGTNVANLQKCLNYIMGTTLLTDGSFGQKTADTLGSFQKKYHIQCDMVYGNTSYKTMIKAVAEKR